MLISSSILRGNAFLNPASCHLFLPLGLMVLFCCSQDGPGGGAFPAEHGENEVPEEAGRRCRLMLCEARSASALHVVVRGPGAVLVLQMFAFEFAVAASFFSLSFVMGSST